MIRTFSRLLPALILLCLASAQAFGEGQALRIVTGASLIQYTNPAYLKPGLWAEYQIRSDGNGVHGEALQKVAITGFETFQGDRCMWVETEYTENNKPVQLCRVLVSLRITRKSMYGDSEHIHDFVRKIQTMEGRKGPVQEMVFPKVLVIDSTNSKQLGQKNLVEKYDTLEATQVTTGAGNFQATPIRHTRSVSFLVPYTAQASKYHYQNEEQTSYRTRRVPLTNLATQLTISKYVDAQVPPGTSPEDVTRTMVMPTTRKECVLTRFGTGAVTAFPKGQKTIPLGVPPEGEVNPIPRGR